MVQTLRNRTGFFLKESNLPSFPSFNILANKNDPRRVSHITARIVVTTCRGYLVLFSKIETIINAK